MYTCQEVLTITGNDTIICRKKVSHVICYVISCSGKNGNNLEQQITTQYRT